MTTVPRKRHCRKQDHNSGWLHPDNDIDPRLPGKGCERPIRASRSIFHLDKAIAWTIIRDAFPRLCGTLSGVCREAEN